MALEAYRSWKPKKDTIKLVAHCVVIIREYMEAGYMLTLRQLYYQLVARDIIPNTEKSYKKISSVCTRARLAGIMDWDAIEDRVRRPHKWPEWNDIPDLVEGALSSYRLPRWETQQNYAELWVEKDALASVLQPLADEYHVTLMVNRGYSSASAMKESAERFRCENYRDSYLFYLGDLDPSGEDMVRDIETRMAEFGVYPYIEKIALTMEQVEFHNPPPNPAKITDPRADAYIAKYGLSSWEVDALTPQVLSEIIRESLDGIFDQQAYDAVIEQEERDKTRLREAVASIMGE